MPRTQSLSPFLKSRNNLRAPKPFSTAQTPQRRPRCLPQSIVCACTPCPRTPPSISIPAHKRTLRVVHTRLPIPSKTTSPYRPLERKELMSSPSLSLLPPPSALSHRTARRPHLLPNPRVRIALPTSILTWITLKFPVIYSPHAATCGPLVQVFREIRSCQVPVTRVTF